MSRNGRRSRGSFREHLDDLIARFEGEQVATKNKPAGEGEDKPGRAQPACSFKLNQGLFERASRNKRS